MNSRAFEVLQVALGSGARWATGGHDLVGTQVVLTGTGVSSRGPGARAVSRKTPEDREDSWFCLLVLFYLFVGVRGGWLHRKAKGMRLIMRFGQKYSKKQGAPLLQRLCLECRPVCEGHSGECVPGPSLCLGQGCWPRPC